MYYAKQSPRGFSNEINVYAFATKAVRDEWVGRHRFDGDVNSATRGAKICSAKDAKAIVHDLGNELTQSFNRFLDGDEVLADEKHEELMMAEERAAWDHWDD